MSVERDKLTQASNQEGEISPEQKVILVYPNGKGGRITEIVTVSSFGEFGLVRRILDEREKLKSKLAQIDEERGKLSKKKRGHHGKPISQGIKKQVLQQLEGEKESIPNRIRAMSATLDSLEGLLEVSNPLDPLKVEMGARMGIGRIEGEPLPSEGQEWWKFVRERAPEIWNISRTERDIFIISHELFIARWRLRQARTQSIGKEAKAQDALNKFIDGIPDEKAESMKPITRKITDYFTLRR